MPSLPPVTLKEAGLAIMILLLLDFIWIGSMRHVLYIPMVQHIQHAPMKIRLHYAIFTYVLLAIMLVVFALPLAKMSLWYPFGLGLLTYGIYNFTNLATLSGAVLTVGLLDTLWGGVVMWGTCVLVQWLASTYKFLKS